MNILGFAQHLGDRGLSGRLKRKTGRTKIDRQAADRFTTWAGAVAVRSEPFRSSVSRSVLDRRRRRISINRRIRLVPVRIEIRWWAGQFVLHETVHII